jgi:hypothetical protein
MVGWNSPEVRSEILINGTRGGAGGPSPRRMKIEKVVELKVV